MATPEPAVDVWLIPSTAEVLDAWSGDPRYRHGFEHVLGGPELRAATPGETVQEMRAAGIGHAILSAMRDADKEVASNRLVAEIVAEHPDHFSASCCIDPRHPQAARRELRSLVRNHGFVGAKLLPWAFDLPSDDRLWYPVYAEAEELGIPVTVQVGHTAPLFSSEVGRPMLLDKVARDFPDLRIVAGHLGWPWVDECLALATKYPNFFIDTSGHTPTRYPAELVQFAASRRGREKVMFGTDYPALPLEKTTRRARQLPLDDEALALFLRGNAERLYRIGPVADKTKDEAP